MKPTGNTHAQLEKELTILRRRLARLEPLSTRTQQAEEELSRFFAQSLDLLCIAGLDGYFKRLNPAWKRTLGWTVEELHDGLCQNLAGIAALSATLSRKLAAGSESAAVEAAEIARLLNETIGQARDLARGLNPVGLEQIGIAAALEALASNVQALHGVACRFQCDRPFLSLGHKVETHLYRIAQEAVNNAITHGRPRRIDISLSFGDRKGLLIIRDDGIGIPQRAPKGKGIGLHTMAYRSRLIGAAMQVQRRARRGTAVTCTFRLPPDPAKERRHAPKKT